MEAVLGHAIELAMQVPGERRASPLPNRQPTEEIFAADVRPNPYHDIEVVCRGEVDKPREVGVALPGDLAPLVFVLAPGDVGLDAVETELLGLLEDTVPVRGWHPRVYARSVVQSE